MISKTCALLLVCCLATAFAQPYGGGMGGYVGGGGGDYGTGDTTGGTTTGGQTTSGQGTSEQTTITGTPSDQGTSGQTTTTGQATGQSTVVTSSNDGGFTVNPWGLNQNYEGEWNAKVGSSVTFIWPEGLHSVYKLNSGDCPSSFDNQEQIAAPTEASQATYNFKNAGTYWFACAVDDHCNQGMKIKFTVA